MRNLENFIRYYGPLFVWPFIPQILVEADGFTLWGKKTYLNEIQSVYYRNSYSPNNTIFPLVGRSWYEILTTTNTLYFYGEHTDLAVLFDKSLEQETNLESETIGLVRRWKQPGSKYISVSIRDEISQGTSEKLATLSVPIKWLWVVIGGAGLLFFVAILVFLFYLIQPLMQQ
jgi:hypothetical protein